MDGENAQIRIGSQSWGEVVELEAVPEVLLDLARRFVHVRGTEAAGTSRDIYLQCLNTLMLEVYYRFLPTSAGKSRGSGLDALDDLR